MDPDLELGVGPNLISFALESVCIGGIWLPLLPSGLDSYYILLSLSEIICFYYYY